MSRTVEGYRPARRAFHSVALAALAVPLLPRALRPTDSPHRRYGVADRFNVFTIGENTNLVKPEEFPKSYEDLGRDPT